MGLESFGVVGFDRGPVLQGRTRILHLQYFFKYVLTYSLHLNSYLVTFLHNTICREQLFCPFLLSGSDFLLNMLFNYHLLYFCTALSLVIMSTPLGGGPIIFAFSAVRRPTWFPDILGNSSYRIFTKFGMQVYWVNSLYGIAFGDDSSIAN